MNPQIIKALRAEIKAAGSQNKAAIALGINSGMISRLLNGTRNPGKKVLSALGFVTKITKRN